jgi:hypothetical protein
LAKAVRPDIYNPIESEMENFVQLDKQARDKRVMNILEYWRLYLGHHWRFNEQYDDRPTIAINKTKILVDKIITHAVARAPYVVYFNDEVEKLLHPFVKLLLENSGGMEIFAYEIFLYAAVTGDAFVKAFVDKDGFIKLQILESHMTDTYYDLIDHSQLIPDMAELRGFNYSREIDMDDGNVKQTLKSVKEIWDSEKVTLFENKEYKPTLSGDNLLGYVPIVHIRNQIGNKDVFGISDVSLLKDLNQLLNSTMRGFQEIVEYTADPWMLMYGYTLEQVDKNAQRALSGLPTEARTELLEMKTDLPAIQDFINYLNTALHEHGGVPIDSTGGKKAMSNVSGTAYHYDLYPITEVVDRKIITHRIGISKAIEMGLDMMYFHAKKYSDSPYKKILSVKQRIESIYSDSDDPRVALTKWNKITIEFNDYLQKDELSRANLIIQKYNNNLLSRRTAMKELGITNIEDEERLILEEVREFGAKDSKIMGTNEIKSDDEKSSSPYAKEENDTLREQEKQMRSNDAKRKN